MYDARADFHRPTQRRRRPLLQGDGALADFLKAIVLHDILYGTRQILAVQFQDMPGAYQWWAEDVGWLNFHAHWLSEGWVSEDTWGARLDQAWSDLYDSTTRAALAFHALGGDAGVNSQRWTSEQLDIIEHETTLNVDVARARSEREFYEKELQECFSGRGGVGPNCFQDYQ